MNFLNLYLGEKYEDDLFVCIEASSHGLEQNRLIGIDAETRVIFEYRARSSRFSQKYSKLY